MNINLPHMTVTALLALAVAWGVEQTAAYRDGWRGKRSLLMAVPIFIVLLIFNLIWPYH